MNRRVTQGDVARAVGLDVSCVNKILRGGAGKFKDATVRRVKRAARSLGYKAAYPSRRELLARIDALERLLRANAE